MFQFYDVSIRFLLCSFALFQVLLYNSNCSLSANNKILKIILVFAIHPFESCLIATIKRHFTTSLNGSRRMYNKFDFL